MNMYHAGVQMGWAIQKFHNIRHVPCLIVMFGSWEVSSVWFCMCDDMQADCLCSMFAHRLRSVHIVI